MKIPKKVRDRLYYAMAFGDWQKTMFGHTAHTNEVTVRVWVKKK